MEQIGKLPNGVYLATSEDVPGRVVQARTIMRVALTQVSIETEAFLRKK